MVEDGSRPTRGIVATLASGWESSLGVIRIGCALIILSMTGVAIGGGSSELAIDVAEVAGDADMRAGQRERSLRMIEIGTRPTGGVVAGGAIGGKTCLHVIRIGGALEILGVAAVAIGGSAREFVIDVAQRTSDADVRAREREWSFRMIEDGSGPAGGVVAQRAIG